MNTCNYSTLLELLLSSESTNKYRVVLGDKDKLIVTGKVVQEICGTHSVVIDTKKITITILFTFVGEETGELFVKYLSALKKICTLRLPVVVILDDCEYLLGVYVNTLKEALKYVSLEKAVMAATYTTLLAKYSELAKMSKREELSEDKYLEYQLALGKIAHYLNRLINVLPSTKDVETLLNLVQKPFEKAVNVEEVFSQVLERALDLCLEFMDVYLVKDLLTECPENQLVGVKRLQQRFEKDNKRMYLLVPRQMKSFLKNNMPEDALIGI